VYRKAGKERTDAASNEKSDDDNVDVDVVVHVLVVGCCGCSRKSVTGTNCAGKTPVFGSS
jgi:hypothetical protein